LITQVIFFFFLGGGGSVIEFQFGLGVDPSPALV
jgi:hypothetical protein